MRTDRNCEIDLLRFIFSVCIVLYHISMNVSSSFCSMGAISTDFFFIVCGMFLSKMRVTDRKKALGGSCKYVFIRFISIYPYYVVALSLKLLFYVVLESPSKEKVLVEIIRSTPSLVFMDSFIGKGAIKITGEWFLTVYFLSMFLCCLGTKLSDRFKTIYSGIIGLTISIVLSIKNGSVILGVEYGVLTLVLRGLSLMLIGIWFASNHTLKDAFQLRQKGVSDKHLTLIKVVGYGVVVLYAFGGKNGFVSLLVDAILVICVTVTYHNPGVVLQGITSYMAKISMIMFIIHSIVIYVCISIFGYMRSDTGILNSFISSMIMLGASILFSIIYYLLLSRLANALKIKVIQCLKM